MIEISATGWLNIAIMVFNEIYFARWFIYDTV